jgi:hypothetical protein
MNLPFTLEQFLAVFVAYNSAIWPAQILLNLLAFIAVILCFRKTVPSKLVSGILAFLWLWTGVVYHWMFFPSINPAAIAFGSIFVAQAILLLVFGVFRSPLNFRFNFTWQAYVGLLLILYALIVYPTVGYFIGHVYPASPTFGAPCPTTIFTFGILLWAGNRLKWYQYVLPLVWALIGSSAAFKLGIREDIGLLIAGVLGSVLLASPHRTLCASVRFLQ